MSHCLNPLCPQPQNPEDANFCQSCGAKLLLEGYRALKLIGQGGFGRTYLAEQPHLAKQPHLAEQNGDRCVIKQFFPRNAASPYQSEKAIEQFRQEAQQLERLGQHPQIPRLIDYFVEQSSARGVEQSSVGDRRPDGQYLIQEYIAGQNLAEALTDGAFSEADIRSLLNDLLPVLQFVHDRQIIHRDIKPENIICPAGGDALVLVDFGASKFADGADLGRTGTVIGSAGYVAPEQAIGRAEYASDLYSLGITCIHLLTAVHPFDLYSVSEDAWVWRQYLHEPVSEALARVLDKLLQRATRLRYRTAAAVLQDLSGSSISVSGGTIALRSAQPVEQGSAMEQSSAAGVGVGQSPVGDHRRTSPKLSPRVPIASGKPNASIAPRGTHSLDTTNPWRLCHTLEGHTGAVTSVAISPDGFFCASGSRDRTLKLWDLATGKLICTFAGRSLWFPDGHSDRISAVTFSPDGETLIGSSDDGTIKLWDLTTQKLVTTLHGHDWSISALAVNGSTLASGGGDGVIHLWDLDTHQLTGSITRHREQISGLALSPDGLTLISSSWDKTIRLWDLQTDRLAMTLKGHRDRVSAIAVSPDWRVLVSSSWDKTLKVWDLSNGAQLQTLLGHSDRISCVVVSPDGQTLASAGEDSTVKLWNLQRGGSKEYGTRVVQHSWGINALCFSPDSQILVSGSTDETLRVWERGS